MKNNTPHPLPISAIILTKDEILHIERCILKLSDIVEKIFVIDCGSTDGTVEVAEKLGATVLHHDWPGLHAEQMNWAIENCPIKTPWSLRIDADEYLSDELKAELRELLPSLEKKVNAVSFPRFSFFLNKMMVRGMKGVAMVRLWRTGCGKCEEKLMDEHIVFDGDFVTTKNPFYDHNLHDLEWWMQKHIGYSLREAADLFYKLDNSRAKRIYRKFPKFLRALIYFCVRYFLKLGFLDGVAGFHWHFFQGLWYRSLVDARLLELEAMTESERRAYLHAHKINIEKYLS